MVKTIIFDFAGVITTTALFPRVAEVFEKRYSINKEIFYKKLKDNEKAYLLGKTTTKNFWKKVCQDTNIPYNVFVKEISWYKLNKKVLSLLKKLEKEYTLILLSDNYDALLKTISKDKSLKNIFQYSFFSNKIEMVKMYDGEKIFNYVLKKIKMSPKDCVFIDDKEANLLPAKKIGIQTILFKDITQLKNELKELKINF